MAGRCNASQDAQDATPTDQTQGPFLLMMDDAAAFYQDAILIAIAEKWNMFYNLIHSEKYLDLALLISKKDDMATALCHHRLGHLHLPAVLKMSNTEVASGMPCLQANKGENRCTACLTGKMTRIPFRASTRRTKASFELVHSDLSGRMLTQSPGGCRYFVLFIDNFTKYTPIYFLKSKNEAAGYFQDYKEAVERFFSDEEKGFKIKAIRTDSGGEYSTGEFQREVKRSGIEWQVTVPYTSQKNRDSENSNRVLVERANALIQHAGTPKSYWAEALQATVYLKNVSLTKGTHGINTTPHQL